MIDSPLAKKWLPVAAADDLPFRHVYQGMLLGHELAIWRADDGNVNVWENRCLHRSVRLSIGVNEGSELRCQYHGWRYANRTASCTFIPAHPANAPARIVCSRTFPVAERHGLVWSAIDPDGDAPALAALDGTAPLVLRAVPINASADVVVDALMNHEFLPVREAASHTEARAVMNVTRLDRSTVISAAAFRQNRSTVVFIVQPVSRTRSVVRGLLADVVVPADRMAVLRHHSERLTALRAAIEASTSGPRADETDMETVDVAPPAATLRGTLRVRIARKWEVAEDAVAFRLEPAEGLLPGFEPGAHIDLHLSNGLVRQYSLSNGPGETAAYIIGVKREPQSTGGSRALHDDLHEGDCLTISEPHNNFRLVRNAGLVVLIAGGIGITPLLAMAKALHAARRPFTLHYFARSVEHFAFGSDLTVFGERVTRYAGLDGPQTATEIEGLLGAHSEDRHLYMCGPGPMLDAARSVAKRLGWPDLAVHFEYFGNTRTVDRSSTFEVALARSGVTLRVPAGKTIVEVLREHGIEVPTSCEQGACGTCLTSVLDGEPDHQDVYLSDSERAQATLMLPCISRSKSARLILDL